MKIQTEVCYVAGPYRAETENGVASNIHRAEKVAIALWQQGYSCLCPHKNTSFLGGVVENDQVWLDGDLLMMIRCDFVVLVEGWSLSSGTCTEIEIAFKYDIPVYTSIVSFQNRTPLTRKFFDKLRCDHKESPSMNKYPSDDTKVSEIVERIQDEIVALSSERVVLQDVGRSRIQAFYDVLKMIEGL